MVETGDKVKIFYKERKIEGVLMPEDKKGFVDIKLSSGYNIGLDKKYVKKIELISKKKNVKTVVKKTIMNSKLPKVSILHTGGTIASKVDYETGAVVAKFEPEDLIEMFPELKKLANIQSKLIGNIMSDDMRFAHYNILAKAIEKEVKNGSKGVIITHGTDTLHYTSAALSFILQNVPIPVLLVGAQRSSDRGSSDSALNLLSAVMFITTADYAGVATCMHADENDEECFIINGCKSRKMHSTRRDAFQPINANPVAIVNYEKKEVVMIEQSEKPVEKLKLELFNEKLRVGMIKVHTQMYAEEFKVFEGFDGLVIEGTGLGHAPISVMDEHTKEHEKIFKILKNLAKRIPVVMTSQTIFGRVNMNVYSPGRTLQEIGVLGNQLDMTSETAFLKIAWLLSNHKKNLKELFNTNLRGEISNRTEN